MSGRLIIGMGTGRCGTQSLATLLDRQHHAEVTHERVWQNIKWSGSEQRVLELIDWASQAEPSQLRGDVAFYYLPYTGFISRQAPGARFICLQRPRDETVNSYMRVTDGKNHWFDHDGHTWAHSMWDDSFPSYEIADKKMALEKYWDDYYAEAERLQAKNPAQFRIFPTETLNSPEGQQAILDFAGVSRSDQFIRPGIRKNTEAERIRHGRRAAARKRRQELKEKIQRLFS